MKVIEPKIELLKIGQDPMQYIERIGRICYKSEDKITSESAPKFISMLYNRLHWAMLEHYFFIVHTTKQVAMLLQAENNKYINFTDDEHGYICSFNARAIKDLYNSTDDALVKRASKSIMFLVARKYNCYELFGLDSDFDTVSTGYHAVQMRVIDLDEALSMFTLKEKLAHCWASIIFTCDRGVSHEIVRHEGQMSFAQESTRYCNYSGDKFGKEITVIRPSWLSTEIDSINGFVQDYKQGQILMEDMNVLLNTSDDALWCKAMLEAEESYFSLLDAGWQAQQARSVLPNSLKTEVAVTARYAEWKHFFSLRCDTPAHPQMRQVALPALELLYLKSPEVFYDQQKEFSVK